MSKPTLPPYVRVLLIFFLYLIALNGASAATTILLETRWNRPNEVFDLEHIIPGLFTLVVFALSGYHKTRVKYPSFGWRLIIGVILMALAYRALQDPFVNWKLLWSTSTSPEIQGSENTSLLSEGLRFLKLVLILPLVEEIVFRKKIIEVLDGNRVQAIVVSSLLFGLIHINPISPDLAKMISPIIFGAIAAIISLQSNWRYSWLFHSTYNLVWFVLGVYPILYNLLTGYGSQVVLYWFIVSTSVGIMIYGLNKLVRNPQ